MKTTSVIFVLLILLLSGCGQEPSPTPTQVPTTTPTESFPPTPIPVTLTPTLASGCTDAAAFVADVTVPDYAHFNQRETFTKTWRVKNIGTCTWASTYQAVYARGDRLNAPLTVPLTNTAPGATLDISANMTAPAADGKFEIFYHLQNSNDKSLPVDDGDSLWALITVGKYVVHPTATPPSSSGSTSASGTSGVGLVGGTCSSKLNPDFVNQTLSLINNARSANGLPALALNAKLEAAAQAHSEDMACHGLLSHTGSDGSTPQTRVAAAGYVASFVQENIYAQPPQYGGDPQAAVDWWLNNDPIHRAAVLNPQAVDVGIGYSYYSGSALGGYFSADFAAP